jgi:predicted nucleotidyltransferase component of viral defense system
MPFESQEALLLWVIGFFGEKFHHHAILKGGMVLRLLDSPRSTNDADFVFVPYASRKDIQKEVRAALDGVPDLQWSDRLDSRAWRLTIRHCTRSDELRWTTPLSMRDWKTSSREGESQSE